MIVVAVLFVWCVLAVVAVGAYNVAKFEVRRRS